MLQILHEIIESFSDRQHDVRRIVNTCQRIVGKLLWPFSCLRHPKFFFEGLKQKKKGIISNSCKL